MLEWSCWVQIQQQSASRMMTVSGPCLVQNTLGFSSTCSVISFWSPAVRIGISSDVYNVTESAGFVRVHVVKTGSNDIFVSVLLNTTAGTALGKHVCPLYR